MRDNFEDPITGIKYRSLLPYGRIKSRSNVLAPIVWVLNDTGYCGYI